MTTDALLGTRGTAWQPETRLYSDGVVAGADGEPIVVPPHSTLRRIPDTGYLDTTSGELAGAALAGSADVVRARARLDSADIPGGDGPYRQMARTALIDIDVLTYPNGAAVAAGSPYWRYVWPRDTGVMATALCAVGWHDTAVRQLTYLARVQESDGGFEARYLPDGSGDVPDGRGRQLDGLGWSLWSSWVYQRMSGRALPDAVSAMVRAATAAAVAAIDPSTGLPWPSPDYWEMAIDEPILGTVAPLLLALRCGRDLLAADDAALAREAGTAAVALDTAVHSAFGPHGYQRRCSGQGGLDASVAFLLPPFAPDHDAVRTAWHAALSATSVPNGGVRPGQEWSDADTAWTPQVSLHALAAAASGDTACAHRLLSWLDLRRTRLGALPEKVTADGRPAAVAPLGLTGATVVLALAHLDGRPLPVPAAEMTNGGRG